MNSFYLSPVSAFGAALCAALCTSLTPTASAQLGVSFCAGATNSTGGPSVISATGSADVPDNDVTLAVSGLPANSLGYFITGPDPGFVANPGGSSGFLCIGGSIGRYAGNILNTGSTGAVTFTLDLTAIPSPTGNTVILPDEEWYFQFWHRDTSPSGPTSNFSPGLAIDFEPAIPTFEDRIWPMLIQPNINAPACTTCHTINGPGGLNLGFTPGMAFSALVSTASTSGNCGGSLYVVPGDPGASLLWDKLSNTPPACGAQMPFGGTFAGDLDVIRDWILAGAPF